MYAAARRLSSILALWTAIVLIAATANANTILYDDFNGNSLDPQWTVSPGAGQIAVSGGNLNYVEQGFANGPAGWVGTSTNLTRSFTGTQWQFDIQAAYSLFWLDSGGGSSGAQRQQVFVSFDENSPFTTYVECERGVDAYYNANFASCDYVSVQGDSSSGNILRPADAAIVDNVAGGTYFYRVVRNGGALTLGYSTDGVNYQTALTGTLANPSGTFNEIIISATTWASVGSVARYGFASVDSLDSQTPEPAAFVLTAVGLGAFWLGRRRLV